VTETVMRSVGVFMGEGGKVGQRVQVAWGAPEAVCALGSRGETFSPNLR
jgi:hypothetical protein